jgi:hypothetical protein
MFPHACGAGGGRGASRAGGGGEAGGGEYVTVNVPAVEVLSALRSDITSRSLKLTSMITNINTQIGRSK